MFSTILHRSTDLRHGAVGGDHAGRRDRASLPAGDAISRDHAADGRGLDDLSRRERQGRGRHRRRADRAAGQRRREHDVPVVAMHQRRQLRADRHVRAGHGLEPGAGHGAEPRLAGRADSARPGQAPRRDGEEEVPQRVDDRQSVFARRQPRQPVPEQLRHDPTARRAVASAGRGRHLLPRPARLQHARLARSAANGDARHQLGRRRARHRAAEHAGRGRADRPAAGSQRARCFNTR